MTDKTDIIDKFLSYLDQDYYEWDFEAEVKFGTDKLRLWSKPVDNDGNELASSELNFRVECYLKDIKPEIAFKCMSDSIERNKWDPRMKDIQKIEES